MKASVFFFFFFFAILSSSYSSPLIYILQVLSSSMVNQATECLPPPLTFLIANFQSFITIKLENSNYFETAFKANCLFHYIDGSFEIPPSRLVDKCGNKIPNSAYKNWCTVDRMVLSCIIHLLLRFYQMLSVLNIHIKFGINWKRNTVSLGFLF